MEQHKAKVTEIALKVREFYEQKNPYHNYHGSTNCTRESTKSATNTVNTSELNNVLLVDQKRGVAQVEPNVPMDKLAQSTLQYGLIPPVVMEFPGITAGGGFAGTSGESSSFRHGFFDRTVLRVELILPNGELTEASPSVRQDLFYGVAASFGTLAIITLLEIPLIEAKPYVSLTYFPIVAGMTEALAKVEEITAEGTCDYLDGIMYSKSKGVICAGTLVDPHKEHFTTTPIRKQQFTRSTDPWFYMHVEKCISNSNGPVTELIPMLDYLFRYDRGGFWVGKYAFEYFGIPQNRLTRWLLDGISHTRAMYHAVHKSGMFQRYTIQDVAVPYDGAVEFMDYLDENFQHYPLWLCPLKQTTQAPGNKQIHGLLAQRYNADVEIKEPPMMMSVGVWGPGPGDRNQSIRFNREMEAKVEELGGQKWLYGRTYYSEEKFWSIYPRKAMEELRKKYHATHLPDLFQKVRVRDAETDSQQSLGRGIWQTLRMDGAYGLLHTFFGKEYLLSSGSGYPWVGMMGLIVCLLAGMVMVSDVVDFDF